MDTRIKHNFGMAKPEGYRKAQRLLLMANKFNLPVITFVDTAGAFPGKDAEERGQSESIASSILTSLKIDSPILSIVIGEGGSGGAIALATADRVLMLEHSIYSVISPEGCSSILWRSNNFTQKAAECLKLTSEDCLKYNIIDSIIEEVPGGAHRFPKSHDKPCIFYQSHKDTNHFYLFFLLLYGLVVFSHPAHFHFFYHLLILFQIRFLELFDFDLIAFHQSN